MGQSAATCDVVVVGAGVIGLAIGWKLAEAGLDVAVVDDAPASAASHAAAGMLAPVTEAHYGEEALLGLNLVAARRWPSFAAEVEAASGLPVGYRAEGTLLVAFDEDDLRVVDDVHRYQVELGLKVERLRGSECRSLEPGLSPRVRGGLFAPDDHQVDTRALTAALLVAATNAGVELVAARVERVLTEVATKGGAQRRLLSQPGGVALTDGREISAGTVVVAAGPWSAGLPGAGAPPVRPVKGQILRLRMPEGETALTHVVRALRHGRGVYLTPRLDGRVVVGATVEEKGFDTTVTAGAVRELLEDAVEVVPALAEAELVEAVARLRPGSPDNAPLVGPGAVDGLVLATGHYRNGVLLAPVTADAVAELLTRGALPDVMAPFHPARFR